MKGEFRKKLDKLRNHAFFRKDDEYVVAEFEVMLEEARKEVPCINDYTHDPIDLEKLDLFYLRERFDICGFIRDIVRFRNKWFGDEE